MKQLRIPKSVSVRFSLEESATGGGVLPRDTSDVAATIEKNGNEIVLAAVMLEERMIEATSKLLFGSNASNGVQRSFFANEIMGTSHFSYAFKRHAFTHLLRRLHILGDSELAKLKSGLNKIMEWRNAFAHGKVIVEMSGNHVLTYYSGGHKEVTLDDAFFELVEDTIRSCLYVCNEVIQSQKVQT